MHLINQFLQQGYLIVNKMKRKYIVLAIASVTLLMGVILSEVLAMAVSVLAIIIYAFIMAVFVIPDYIPKQDGKENTESHKSQA